MVLHLHIKTSRIWWCFDNAICMYCHICMREGCMLCIQKWRHLWGKKQRWTWNQLSGKGLLNYSGRKGVKIQKQGVTQHKVHSYRGGPYLSQNAVMNANSLKKYSDSGRLPQCVFLQNALFISEKYIGTIFWKRKMFNAFAARKKMVSSKSEFCLIKDKIWSRARVLCQGHNMRLVG